MKLLYLTLLLCIQMNYSVAQKPNYVGGGHQFEFNYDSELIADLKSSELVFFMKPEQIDLLSAYEAVFTKEWTFCDFRIVNDFDQFEKELENTEGKFFMSVATSSVSQGIGSLGPYALYLNYRPYLTIWKPRLTKKGVLNKESYSMLCAIPLIHDQIAFAAADSSSNKTESASYYEYIRFHNWTPQHIGLFLKVAQYNILNTKFSIEMADGRKVNAKAGRLKTANLIIPEFTFDDRIQNGLDYYDKLESDSPIPFEEILADYTWKYTILNSQDFENYNIQENDYYLCYQRGGINVFSMYTGEIIFHAPFQPSNTWSFEITQSKFNKLVKAVNKKK